MTGPDGPVLTATKTDKTDQVALNQATLTTLQALRCRADRIASEAGVGGDGGVVRVHSDPDGRQPWLPGRSPTP